MSWYPAPARFAAATYRHASSENRCQPIAGEHLPPASRPGTAGRRTYRGGPSDLSAARTVFLKIPSTRRSAWPAVPPPCAAAASEIEGRAGRSASGTPTAGG